MEGDQAAGAAAAPYCDQCGLSLVPLKIPHTSRACPTCAKTIHVQERGEDGGIKIRKGDKFTLPAGAISMSMDPRRSNGRFARHGLTWFMRMVYLQAVSKGPEALDDLLAEWDRESDMILAASERLSDYDLTDENDGERVVELLKDDQYSVEFWAMSVGLLCQDLRQHLTAGVAGAEAAHAAIRVSMSWAMMVYLRDLEEHVWTGYNQNQLIYGIAKAGASTPAEAEAIVALEPVFGKLSESVLHAWVESGADIGPKVGVSGVDEPVLRALAAYHLGLFERRRATDRADRDHKVQSKGLLISAFGAGAAVATVVLAILKTIGVV